MEIKTSKPGIARSVSENRAITEAMKEKESQSSRTSSAAPSASVTKQTELKEGQRIRGQIQDLRYNEVRIQLEPGGQTITARLAGDVPLSIGEEARFEVTESTTGKLVLKYIPENADAPSETSALNATILKALNASGFSLTERNKAVAAELLTHRMPVDKQTLQILIKAAVTNREASPHTLVLMYKNNLPLTPANIRQFEAYQNGTGQLLKDIKGILTTIHELLPSGAELPDAGIGHNAMAQLLRLNSSLYYLLEANPGDAANKMNWQANSLVMNNSSTASNDYAAVNVPTAANLAAELPNSSQIAESLIMGNNEADRILSGRSASGITGSTETESINIESFRHNYNIDSKITAILDTILKQFPAFNTDYSKEMEALKSQLLTGTAQAKDILALIQKTLPLMPEEATGKLLTSPEYHTLLEQSFRDKWTLTPEKLADKASVKELYQNIREDMDRLSTLIKTLKEPEEAVRLQEPVKNLQENLQVLRDLNEIFPYVQLPIQLKEQDVHGELYVFSRKKAATAKENIRVLLHLEIESLGSMNIHLQLDHNILQADFYMEQSEAERIVKEHMSNLTEALAKKGYSLHSMVTGSYQKPDPLQDFTLDSKVDSSVNRYTFDIRT